MREAAPDTCRCEAEEDLAGCAGAATEIAHNSEKSISSTTIARLFMFFLSVITADPSDPDKGHR